MDLTTFAFPSVNAVDRIFPDFITIPDLLAEVQRRGFYEARTPYNRLSSTLFSTVAGWYGKRALARNLWERHGLIAGR